MVTNKEQYREAIIKLERLEAEIDEWLDVLTNVKRKCKKHLPLLKLIYRVAGEINRLIGDILMFLQEHQSDSKEAILCSILLISEINTIQTTMRQHIFKLTKELYYG
jgi:hypothetical protein